MENVVSSNRIVNMVLRSISDENKKFLQEYFMSMLGRNYQQFYLDDEIKMALSDEKVFLNDEVDVIRKYSGFHYRDINNALRGKWNYSENGNVSGMESSLKDGQLLSSVIENHPTSFGNCKMFRGVDLAYFKDYGITCLSDLKLLEGQYLYDLGFVSTSLIESQCFFNKENELGKDYNIKMVYLIPEEFDDGIYLQNDMTYNEGQKEYLINNANLARVVSVRVNEDKTATLTVAMIPKKIYDEYYQQKQVSNGNVINK